MGRRSPRRNATYWRKKIEDNMARDTRNLKALGDLGWAVLVVWECWVKNKLHREKMLREFLQE